MSLQQAITSLHGSEVITAESCEALLAASRDGEGHPELLRDVTFQSVLRQLDRVHAGDISDRSAIEERLLRCLGNLIAFEPSNAAALAENGNQLRLLAATMHFTSLGEDDCNLRRATTVISVLHNLCCSYNPGPLKCYEAGLDLITSRYIETCLFIGQSDHADTAIELLTEILASAKDATALRTYDEADVRLILRLGNSQDMDAELFFSYLGAVLNYFSITNFREAVLQSGSTGSAFHVLEHAVFLLQGFSHASEGKRLTDLLMNCIVDVSHLPGWPSTFSRDDPFTLSLIQKCVVKETDTDNALLSCCACTLVANYALNNDAARFIADHVRLNDLFDCITLAAYHRNRPSSAGLPDQTNYLWLVAGLLRHLLRNPQVKAKHFDNAASMQAAFALSRNSSSDVQSAGMGVLRQLIFDNPSSVEAIESAGFRIFLVDSVDDPRTEAKVKFEIARTVASLIRSIEYGITDSVAADTLLGMASIYTPLVLVIKDAPSPFAVAEAYSGLCLAMRKAPALATGCIAEVYKTDVTLRQSLLKHVTRKDDMQLTGETLQNTSQQESLPIQGLKAGSIANLARQVSDNAIILLSELLKHEDLDHELRDQLDSIASQAKITLVL